MGAEQHGSRLNPAALPFLVSLVVTAMVFWTVDIVSPALPVLKTDLGLSAKATGLVFASLFLGRLLGNFPAARLVDLIGAGKTGAVGSVLLAAGSGLIAVAPGVWLVYPGRVFQGFGIAFVVNAVLRSLIRNRPGRGDAITLFQFSATIGTVCGLEVGGLVTEALGWRAVFVLSVAIAGVIALVALGAPGVHPPISDRAQAIETTAAAPLRMAVVAPALGYNFLVFANYGIFVSTPLYAERHFHASAVTNANLLLVITVMHLVGAFPSGRAIRSHGPRLVMAAGIALSCLGMLAVPLAPQAIWIAPGLVLYGLGMITASNATGDHVLEVCGRNARAIGLLRLSCDLGLMVGPFAVGAMADSFGYLSPFYVLPVISLLPIIAAFRRQSGKAQGNETATFAS